MDFGAFLTSLLELLAGVGIFIIGMNFMSEGLEKGTGKGLKTLLGKISNNRFAGVGIGTAVTAIIQLSSATSVMVIGLVNAGVMTLFQAASVILGANIGTTVTGLIVALSGESESSYPSFSQVAIVLAFIGVMMMFFKKNDKIKLTGTVLCGLGTIFVGLGYMSDALKSSEAIKTAFTSMFDAVEAYPVLLIVLGAIFTAIIQSSSAATGIIIIMAGAGGNEPIISVQAALFIVLGSNIGTCATALLACIGTGTNAKRTTFIHFFVKIVGNLVFATILIFTKDWFVNNVLEKITTDVQFQIAIFHFMFNLLNTIMLLPFVRYLVKLAELVIKDKKTDKEEEHLKYVDERLLVTPAIAYEQVKKEIEHMAHMAKDNICASLADINEPSKDVPSMIYAREKTINFTNKALTDFLIKLSTEVNMSDEKHIGAFFHVINDLERIGDHAKNFIEISEEMVEKELKFSQDAKDEIANMSAKVMQMFDLTVDIFDSEKADSSAEKLAELSRLEAETDNLKKENIAKHYTRLSTNLCDATHSPYYVSIITRLERVGDHLVNVGYSVVNPTGSQA
ncbi:MAG: Na/Pi cotransporter family protein [Clostridia bacterium]|nr:Na/Pi cotransporter family protein [Clostridia bacterium]